jgi:cytochrome c biogenesis protein CcmG/thiol:disulfide interchange protein DsbE
MLRSLFPRLVLIGMCFSMPGNAPAVLTTASSRNPAPDFTLRNSKGASVKLSTYKGKVVLLDFWVTWCEGCKVEIPWYMDFRKKYKKNGLAVVGVSMDEDGSKSVTPFPKKKKVNSPVVVGDWDLASKFGISALPVTLLIDRDGKIADLHTGMVDKDAFESEIQILLRESSSGKAAK